MKDPAGACRRGRRWTHCQVGASVARAYAHADVGRADAEVEARTAARPSVGLVARRRRTMMPVVALPVGVADGRTAPAARRPSAPTARVAHATPSARVSRCAPIARVTRSPAIRNSTVRCCAAPFIGRALSVVFGRRVCSGDHNRRCQRDENESRYSSLHVVLRE